MNILGSAGIPGDNNELKIVSFSEKDPKKIIDSLNKIAYKLSQADSPTLSSLKQKTTEYVKSFSLDPHNSEQVKIIKACQSFIKKIEEFQKIRLAATYAASQAQGYDTRRKLSDYMLKDPPLIKRRSTSPEDESRHPVYLEETSGAAIKGGEEVAKMEVLANEVCGLMGVSSAIHTSVKGHITGTQIEDSSGQLDGNIQPLIARKIATEQLQGNKELLFALTNKLDKADSQLKILVQGLLGNMDSHLGNVFFVPKVNSDFIKNEKLHWEYQNQEGAWIVIKNMTDFAALYQSHKITNTTLIRNENRQSPLPLKENTSLQNALVISWKLIYFDNEDCFPQHNDFTLIRNTALIPVQQFALGLDISREPLDKKVKFLLKEIQGHTERLRSFLSKGNPVLWQRLSPQTQELLKLYLSSENYIRAANKRNSPHSLLRSMSPELTAQIVHDLKKRELEPLQDEQTAIKEKIDSFIEKVDEFRSHVIAAFPKRTEEFDLIYGSVKNHLQYFLGSFEDPDLLIGELRDFFSGILDDARGHPEIMTLGKALKNQCQSLIEELSDTPLQAKKEEAKKILVKYLFPYLSPAQIDSFLERIEKANTYVFQCEEFLKDFQNECDKNDPIKILKVGGQLLLESLTPAAEFRLLEQKKNVLLEQANTQVRSSTFEIDFKKWIDDIVAALSPTIMGIYRAMFPKEGFYFDLLKDCHLVEKDLPLNTEKLNQRQLQDIHLDVGTALGHFDDPCDKILQRALNDGLFEGGKENPIYKQALNELQEAKKRG